MQVRRIPLGTAIATAVSQTRLDYVPGGRRSVWLDQPAVELTTPSRLAERLTIVLPARVTRGDRPADRSPGPCLDLLPWATGVLMVGLCLPDVIAAHQLDRWAHETMGRAAGDLARMAIGCLAPELQIAVTFDSRRLMLDDLTDLVQPVRLADRSLQRLVLISQTIYTGGPRPFGRLLVMLGLVDDLVAAAA